MENKQNKIRKNITISPEIWAFIENQADAFGISPSSCLAMIVGQYREQNSILKEISKLQDQLTQFQDERESQLTFVPNNK